MYPPTFFTGNQCSPHPQRPIPVDEPTDFQFPPLFVSHVCLRNKFARNWCEDHMDSPTYMALQGNKCWCSERPTCDELERVTGGQDVPCLRLIPGQQAVCDQPCNGNQDDDCGKSNVLLPVAPVSRSTPSLMCQMFSSHTHTPSTVTLLWYTLFSP